MGDRTIRIRGAVSADDGIADVAGGVSSTELGSNLTLKGNTVVGESGADTLTVTAKLTGLLYNNDSGKATGALKLHSHLMQSGVEYANEFKGEFLSTSGLMDGIAAHYHMAASGTGVMRSIIGVAYLDTGITLSGADPAASWISGILGSVSIAGVVDGAAVTVTGVYGGLGSMVGGTLTLVKDMSAVWADSQVTQVPVTGDSQLFLGTNGAGATLGQAIKIDGSDRITNLFKLANVSGMVSDTAETGGAAKKIKILIGTDTYYINAYAGT